MGKTKALIVGVSYYYLQGANDLPFCKNDIYAISNSLAEGLNISPSDLSLLGETGIVTASQFIRTLSKLSVDCDDNDTLILYFSGHGTTSNDQHYLVFSDKCINTQIIIDYLNTTKAKSKIIFLDCCMAGCFSVNGTAVFDINQTIEEFVGSGCAVFAACNAQQYSYGHPDKPISLFTNFLCYALTDKAIVRDGKKSLHDIHKLLFLFLDIWNKNHPEKAQTPIYRANLGGTIYFVVQDYTPYRVASFVDETERYYITSVEPLHNGIAKRYAVKVILKIPYSFMEIAKINQEIVRKVRRIDIFTNPIQETHWSGKPTNIVFCYYALDENDVVNGNYICHTTWVDETQDKAHWYRISKGNEIIDGVFFSIHPYYQSLKSFILNHTATKKQIISSTKTIIYRMITLAEQIISHFNEFDSKQLTEEELVASIESAIPELDKLYFAESNLDFPPSELDEWCQCCSNLAATIHDFTLFYNSKFLSTRTPDNRKSCMEITIKRYYQELERLKHIDIESYCE